MMLKSSLAMMPIRIAITYLLGTFALFVAAPVKWELDNYPTLLTYVAIYYGALYLGYRLRATRCVGAVLPESERPLGKMLVVLFVISCTFAAVSAAALKVDTTGQLTITWSELLNPGESYFEKKDYTASISEDVSALTQFSTVFNVMTYFYVPIGILYWRQLGATLRIAFVFTAVFYALVWMAIGTNKGLGDLLVSLLVSFAASYAIREKGVSRRHILRVLVTITVCLSAFISFFVLTQASRASHIDQETEDAFDSRVLATYATYVSDGAVGQALGKTGMSIIISAYPYVSMGYFGFAKSLELPFEWTYGAGNSRALTSYIRQYTGRDLQEKTYIARNEVESGWPSGTLWSTAFPWFASDLSFIGVAGLMFAIGWYFAGVWFDFLTSRSILPAALLCQLAILILYLPANNQLMQSRSSLWGTTTILLIDLFARRWGRRARIARSVSGGMSH